VDIIHRQPIQVSSAVDMPSSGSASVKEDKIAIIEMAVARIYGSVFFMIRGSVVIISQ